MSESKRRRNPKQPSLPIEDPDSASQTGWISKKKDGKTLSTTITHFGYPMDEVRSALQKAIRRGEEERAAWWALNMIKHGYQKYFWRTIATITSEDVGLGDPTVPAQVAAIIALASVETDGFKYKFKGATPGILQACHACIILCRAAKDWQATHLMCLVGECAEAIESGEQQPPPIPDEALDCHTARGRRRGRTEAHWWAEGDQLEPKAPTHHVHGTDPFAYVREGKLPTEEPA